MSLFDKLFTRNQNQSSNRKRRKVSAAHKRDADAREAMKYTHLKDAQGNVVSDLSEEEVDAWIEENAEMFLDDEDMKEVTIADGSEFPYKDSPPLR